MCEVPVFNLPVNIDSYCYIKVILTFSVEGFSFWLLAISWPTYIPKLQNLPWWCDSAQPQVWVPVLWWPTLCKDPALEMDQHVANVVVVWGIPHPAVVEPESVGGWQAEASELPWWGVVSSDRCSHRVVMVVMLLEAMDKPGSLEITPCLPQVEQECILCRIAEHSQFCLKHFKCYKVVKCSTN